MPPKKIRADILLVEQGLVETRSKAQTLILSGSVYQGTQRIDKASAVFSPDQKLEVRGKPHAFVGRGGVKLAAALKQWSIDPHDKICLDVGVSTGGFTDCLLQGGASKVYAVDVGYGQLDYKLRQDKRVVLFERTNFRHFDITQIKEPIDIVVVDVSFISLKLILPKIVEIFSRNKNVGAIHELPLLVTLIKPQFEVGKENVGKGGIVRDEEAKKKAVAEVIQAAENLGLKSQGTIASPITGQDGNEEFLGLFS